MPRSSARSSMVWSGPGDHTHLVGTLTELDASDGFRVGQMAPTPRHCCRRRSAPLTSNALPP